MTKTATLRRVVQSTIVADASATDQELLRRFATADDEAAFATLVRRHTGLVLGVCRRALAGGQVGTQHLFGLLQLTIYLPAHAELERSARVVVEQFRRIHAMVAAPRAAWQ